MLNIFQIIIKFNKQLLGGYQIDSRLHSDGEERLNQQHATVSTGGDRPKKFQESTNTLISC